MCCHCDRPIGLGLSEILRPDLSKHALRQEQGPSKPVTIKETGREEKRVGGKGGPIVCAKCEQAITTSHAKISVNSQHEHVCINPLGIAYHIGCFEWAPGCLARGEVSDHWTWFPGYTWQVVLCGACLLHLGWLFQGSEGSFYGLILTRLSER